jgi:serine O-acetyltransferase
MIIGKVTIGDGAKIGPNAVILSDVPAGATAFATPARIIYPPQPAGPTDTAAEDAAAADAAGA